MLLGVEIGGTKLQVAIGDGRGGPLTALARRDVVAADGAEGILRQLEQTAGVLLQQHAVEACGVGFGGPVIDGRVFKSHQIDGWEQFELAAWCGRRLGLPTTVVNDCDAAAVAEARFGAGRGAPVVFFVTVGTGVGGGLVIHGQLQGAGRPASAEIGHLRPGLQADHAEQTVESLASGWGIAAEAAARVRGDWSRPLLGLADGDHDGRAARLQSSVEMTREFANELLARCEGDLDQLTAQQVVAAAYEGNALAMDAWQTSLEALGWAIAQVITLLAPDVVVVGGGVSLQGEERFFHPLRAAVRRYVFPPLQNACRIEPAELGEEVVLHGALALASEQVAGPE